MLAKSAAKVFLFFLCLFSFSLVEESRAAIIIVPDLYPTIQQGINAASNSDIVRVRAGTYIENINFGGKRITVEALYPSVDPSLATVIDGNQAGSVVTFQQGEQDDSILRGFVIKNGRGPYYNIGSIATGRYGSGIICGDPVNQVSVSPLIDGNIIVSNGYNDPTCDTFGGGIACLYESLPTIRNNTIGRENEPNIATQGGGIHSDEYSTPRIENNVIAHNNAYGACCGMFGLGGGISIRDSYLPNPEMGGTVTIIGNTISNNIGGTSPNVFAGGGAGIFSVSSLLEIVENVIEDNVSYYGAPSVAAGGGGIHIAEYHDTLIYKNHINNNDSIEGSGGGIHVENSSRNLIIDTNRISNNIATNDGGGIYYIGTTGVSSEIRNNLIINNTTRANSIAGSGGAGICIVDGDQQVLNNTIGTNTANGNNNRGGGILFKNVWAGTTVNTYNNIAYYNTAATGAQIHDVNGAVVVDWNCIQGGYPTGPNNFTNPPLFIPNNPWYKLSGNPATNPCIEGGNRVVYSLFDFEGEQRPKGAFPDVGWDEK
jgi:hypothetical protein